MSEAGAGGSPPPAPASPPSSAPASTVLVTPRKLAPGFLAAVNPQLIVFFAGPTARDQPSADLLAALSSVTLLRTDVRGTVELIVEAEGVRMSDAK